MASVQMYEQDTMALLNAVLESATNATVVYDAEHDALLTNHKAFELHGMPPPSDAFEEWGAYYEARRPGGEPLPHRGAAAVARMPRRARCRDAARDPPASREGPGSSTSEPSRSSTRTGS